MMKAIKTAVVAKSEEIVRGQTSCLLFVSWKGARLQLEQGIFSTFSSGYRSDSTLDTLCALTYLDHWLLLFKLHWNYHIQADTLSILALRL